MRRHLSLIATLGSIGCNQLPPVDEATAARLSTAGWIEEKASDGMKRWRGPDGDVLSLTAPDPSDPLLSFSTEAELQRAARLLAQQRDGGLIEVEATHSRRMVSLIYKRLLRPAYVYTGMLIIQGEDLPLIWTVVSGERGTTGVREAIITTELLNAGELTLEDYKRSWAQDPYDPAYHGVDRSVLRFRSDDKRYDSRFPWHPLTKVRQILAGLRENVGGS